MESYEQYKKLTMILGSRNKKSKNSENNPINLRIKNNFDRHLLI